MGTNRDWMYKRLDDNYLSEEFVEKVEEFIKVASKEEHFKKYGKVKCPCDNCWNVPYLDEDTVKLHTYKNGFRPNYYQWTYHGELNMELGVNNGMCTSSRIDENSIRDMVMDVFGPMSSNWAEEGSSSVEEDPNPDMKAFFDMIQAAEKPLYDGCQSSINSIGSRLRRRQGEYEGVDDEVYGDGFEVDPEDGDCDQHEDETEDQVEDAEEDEDQYEDDEEDEDENADDELDE